MIDDANILYDALEGKRGDNQKRIATVGLKVVATLLRKNHDYGSSVWKTPVLAPDVPPAQAILVRMSDKVARIAQLATSKAEVNESLDETLLDLAGYAILKVAMPTEQLATPTKPAANTVQVTQAETAQQINCHHIMSHGFVREAQKPGDKYVNYRHPELDLLIRYEYYTPGYSGHIQQSGFHWFTPIATVAQLKQFIAGQGCYAQNKGAR